MSNRSNGLPDHRVAVVGGGPAGLFAAETLRAAGLQVDLYEAKGSPGRKFLIAGKGGLNLTHSDPRPLFDSRYRPQPTTVGQWLDGFDAVALREWAAGLGVETYVGSSGRVFPVDRKAAPLLRGWVRRLKEQGVRMHVNHRWLGWDAAGQLRFATDTGEQHIQADATVLALGGASWPQLGSDGAWVALLEQQGIAVAPLQAANCGFDVDWTPWFAQRHAGAPLKAVVGHWLDLDDQPRQMQGECVISAYGIEGSLVYALSADLRERLRRDGEATLWLDLVPDRDAARLLAELSRPRKGRSFGEHLRRQAGLDAVKTALVFEVLGKDAGQDVPAVVEVLKRLPVTLQRPRPVAEAISTAGGVMLASLDAGLMLRQRPGTFVAGEMLDWEAPTGGYLLTACYASARQAAHGVIDWLTRQ
ncbi:TIGR03862 family flavoprotein [Stenotrophomonas sp. C3(2023)]|uniref:TIGR03862 family flavoprotein n=1 Tax=Stenotrophomonas sp. C3(2023) TaxID=3080277 RepID=UPI00293C427E|nr:TIGR03862 family flavoprotein [Stenotrophomonas sp. C3(2023)]MDV3469128.1 TIGR03862 family flavoprotein [Stenotrophomonas sp. C3(2023)]